MANKLKGLAGAMSEHQLAATIRGSARQIWLAGLGAFSTARVQGNKVFDALAREGANIQRLTQRAAEARVRQAAAKAVGTRRRLEHALETSVARSMRRFGVPTKKDVATLSRRVAALTALVDRISAELARKRAAAKPAASTRR